MGSMLPNGYTMELTNCTGVLLREIAMPEMKRKQISQTYALALRSSEATDWKAVNEAIVKRWSLSCLTWIKEQAWSGKCFSKPAERKNGRAKR